MIVWHVYSGFVEKNAFVKIRAKIKDKFQTRRGKLRTTTNVKESEYRQNSKHYWLCEKKSWFVLRQIYFNAQKKMTIKCGKKNDFSDIEWLLSASFGTNWIKRFSSVAYVNTFTVVELEENWFLKLYESMLNISMLIMQIGKQ